MANHFIKQSILKIIRKEKPSHVVKAKIDSICIHHGSLHSLKAGRYLNDEISMYFQFHVVQLCFHAFLFAVAEATMFQLN